MSTTSQRVAHVIIRLYPRRWRVRYESELIALVEDTGTTSRTIVDLFWGAGREWVRVIAGQPPPTAETSGERPLTVYSPDLRFHVLGFSIALLALASAHALRSHVPPPNDLIMYPAFAVMFGGLLRVVIVGLSYRKPARQLAWALSGREVAAWAILMFVALVASDLDHLSPPVSRSLLPLWLSTSINGMMIFGNFGFATKRGVGWRQYLKRLRLEAMRNPPTGLSSGL